MKKIALLIAVVFLAAPALAVDDVYITTTQVGPDGSGHFRIYVSYDASGASSTVSGFGFDVECDSGATILDIADYKTDGYSTEDNPGVGVYLESMTWKSDPNDGVADWGDPTADDRDSLPGVGYSGMTICMGALYDPCTIDPNPNAPEPTGLLFSFKVDKLCVVKFTPDTETRGGTVMADGSVANTPVKYHVVAWEVPGQSSGDTDFNTAINTTDFLLFGYSFGFTYTQYDPTGATVPPAKGYYPQCDFDHNGAVNTSDFLIFSTNFGKPFTPVLIPYVWPPF
jgi:hypothetical protein